MQSRRIVVELFHCFSQDATIIRAWVAALKHGEKGMPTFTDDLRHVAPQAALVTGAKATGLVLGTSGCGCGALACICCAGLMDCYGPQANPWVMAGCNHDCVVYVVRAEPVPVLCIAFHARRPVGPLWPFAFQSRSSGGWRSADHPTTPHPTHHATQRHATPRRPRRATPPHGTALHPHRYPHCTAVAPPSALTPTPRPRPRPRPTPNPTPPHTTPHHPTPHISASQ